MPSSSSPSPSPSPSPSKTIPPVARVAVIGAGPSGAITLDALVRENVFAEIRVFERREGPGGCWIGDSKPPPPLTNLAALAARTGDPPLPVPAQEAAVTPRQQQQQQPRFAESSIYPYLETNVDDRAMSFTGGGGAAAAAEAEEEVEAIPATRSEWSVRMHGADTPFRHWTVMRDYVAGLFARRGAYDGRRFVEYGVWVERVVKDGGEWVLTLRRRRRRGGDGEDGEKEQEEEDVWSEERFDAVVVASGHFHVPWVPAIEGLEELERARTGSVLHSKMFRGREAFRNKVVVVVGASVSGADIAYDLATHRVTKDGIVHAVVLGHTYNGYFGDVAFCHPRIQRHPSISRIDAATRTVHFVDGTRIADVDHLVFGTGYSWSLPFLQPPSSTAGVVVRNNRVPGLYQHVVWREDPTLLFVGAVGAGLTFKIFEWQAVYAARVLAGRGTVPSKDEMAAWEEARVRDKGDGPAFQMVYPAFEEYFEKLRALAGPPTAKGEGRTLPPFDEGWVSAFMDGHERRKDMWRRLNAQARAEMEGEQEEDGSEAVPSRI